MRRLFGCLMASCLVCVSTIVSADNQSADTIMTRNFYTSKVSTLRARATMGLTSAGGGTRERKVDVLSKLKANGIDARIRMRFEYPPDIRGTTFVQIENAARNDDLWIYLPALKKVRRLVANNKKDSFVGSDFSYGDILPTRPSLFKHTLLRSEACGTHECYVIRSEPINEQDKMDLGYGYKLTWVRKDSFLESRVEYYDAGGQLVKTQEVSKQKMFDATHGKWLALRREMTNVRTGHKTVFVLDDVVVGGPVPDAVFSPMRLEER